MGSSSGTDTSKALTSTLIAQVCMRGDTETSDPDGSLGSAGDAKDR